MTRVSVIIPTLNEEARIAATITAARAAGVDEVIVADGGSSDATIAIASSHGARVILGERIRAKQLNRGAAEATGDVLIFLHADTLLPPGAADAVRNAPGDCGGFLVELIEPRCGHVSHGVIIAEGSGAGSSRRHGHQSRQRASAYATASTTQPPTASRK